MATHSSVLAWRIPGTGEPRGLPSMGSHSQTWLKRLSSSSSVSMELPQWLRGKESAWNVGDTEDVGLIPGSGRSPGGGHGSPFQYSCLENPMDRGAWGLQSMELQRVRHDWSDLAHTAQQANKDLAFLALSQCWLPLWLAVKNFVSSWRGVLFF